MLNLLIALAGTALQTAPVAPAPATPAPAAGARSLTSLPNVTIKYYDVPGKDEKAIEKNLKKLRTNPQTKVLSVVDSNWNVEASVQKTTTNGKCVITGITTRFSGSVELPRLADEKGVAANALANWRTYATGLERAIADNFYFVYDQIPAMEKTVIGQDCAKAGDIWTNGMDRLKAAASENGRQAAAAAAAADAAAAAAAKAKAKEDAKSAK